MWLKETRQRIFDLMEKASRSNDERERVSNCRVWQLPMITSKEGAGSLSVMCACVRCMHQILQRRNDMIKENEMERKNFEEDYLKLGDYIDMQNTLFGT